MKLISCQQSNWLEGQNRGHIYMGVHSVLVFALFILILDAIQQILNSIYQQLHLLLPLVIWEAKV